MTLAGYLLIVRRIAPHHLIIWWALAFPGAFQNFGYGQNGFLSVILLGGGLLLLESNPFLGGLLLGLFSYKPHLAVLVPLALLAGRRWRALAGLLTGALGLALASLWVFGPDIWRVFLGSLNSLADSKLTPKTDFGMTIVSIIFSPVSLPLT